MDTACPFLGVAYQSRSKSLADQRLVNAYPEIVESKSGAEVGAFYGTPGLNLLGSAPNGGVVRGLHTYDSTYGNQMYAVCGNAVYLVSPSYAFGLLGTIASSSGPVSMIDNGFQTAIFDNAGNAYTIASGALAPISLPFIGPGIGISQDDFGLVSQVGTFNIWQSNNGDLTTWDALDFDTADGQPDDIVALGELHRQMIVLKQNNLEVWVNQGTAGFAFQRLDGVYPSVGCAAPYSVANVGETLLWLSRNKQGQGIVYSLNGYEPQRMSTHAIEYEIGQYSTISDAVGFGYQQEGHIFYQLTFPSGNATWVLDLTASNALGFPAWHQRAAFANGQFSRHRANCCCYFNGQVIVGDYSNGNIYGYSLDAQTDNGQMIKRVRSFRASSKDSIKPERFNMLEILCQTGIGVPPGTDPQLVLRYSDDSFTWSNEIFAPWGRTGETGKQVLFPRLGSTKRGQGLDRIFELSTTDPVPVAWLGARLR